MHALYTGMATTTYPVFPRKKTLTHTRYTRKREKKRTHLVRYSTSTSSVCRLCQSRFSTNKQKKSRIEPKSWLHFIFCRESRYYICCHFYCHYWNSRTLYCVVTNQQKRQQKERFVTTSHKCHVSRQFVFVRNDPYCHISMSYVDLGLLLGVSKTKPCVDSWQVEENSHERP